MSGWREYAKLVLVERLEMGRKGGFGQATGGESTRVSMKTYIDVLKSVCAQGHQGLYVLRNSCKVV